jgi:hypothetical protein
VASDAFIHGVDQDNRRADKIDALVMHVGTRESRLVWVRTYRIERGAVVFDEPSRKSDLDVRRDPNLKSFEDPYATIFVSTPPAPRPQ